MQGVEIVVATVGRRFDVGADLPQAEDGWLELQWPECSLLIGFTGVPIYIKVIREKNSYISDIT
jgi:hypothetical protein